MFALEKKIAQIAVKRASMLAQTVSQTSRGPESITKSDDSPVTVADFGAQAVIINAILKAFPQDKIVGEEDAGKLRNDTNLRDKVFAHVKSATEATEDYSPEIGKIKTAEEMMDSIDKGNYEGGAKGRMWALDPIDGTKGYLRKGQYAVCLALIVDSQVVLGVIGCPNLLGGTLFSAVKGQGAYYQALYDNEPPIPIKFNDIKDLSKATFCESVEAGHSSHGTQARIAQKLGIVNPSVRMDSQAKYCSISKGDGDIYLRLPVNDKYQEKI